MLVKKILSNYISKAVKRRGKIKHSHTMYLSCNMKLKIKEKTFQAKKEIKKWSYTGKQCGRMANRSVWETCLKLIFTFTILFFTTSGPEITPSPVMPVQIIAFTSKKTKTLKRHKVTHADTFFVSHTPPSSPHTWHIPGRAMRGSG